ncbi:hypothetical protein FS837_006278 [Tulasnella sp. UAMH 9824]|nr:hypothetical protein FS837_006278 [Tulasnella sp. UAMH 9824]
MADCGIILQSRMESSSNEFYVEPPGGFATILPLRHLDLPVERVADDAPEPRSGTYDRIVFYWRPLVRAELPLLQGANHLTFRQLWDAARARTTYVLYVPIEIFNKSRTKRPFKTWKDERKWTRFVYRPEIENRAAFFRPEESRASRGGGFGRVWKCTMRLEGDNRAYRVAVKEIKLTQATMHGPVDRERIMRRANQELDIWKRLHHENVGSIIGWFLDSDAVCLMSLWYPNEDVLSFIQGQSQRFRPMPEQRKTRWGLVQGITEGLAYLHSRNVIHGDLCYPQVLVDEHGTAKIVDFGLGKVIEEGVDTKITTSVRFKGRYQYMAPELFRRLPPRVKATDVYSYGLLILEVAAARIAFDGLPAGPAEVVRKTIAKEHLPNPKTFELALREESVFWNIFTRCTQMDLNTRPSMAEVVGQIKAITPALALETIYSPWPPVGRIYQETPRKNKTKK